MTFMSALAVLLTVLLMIFGVNLSGRDAAATTQPTAAPTEEVAPTEEPASTEEVIVTEAPVQATEIPTEAPTMQPAPTAVNTVVVTEDEAVADAQTVTTALFTAIIGDTAYQPPLVIEDNADTHLAARWVDYKNAALAASGIDLQAFRRPGIEPSRRSMYAEGSLLVYEIDCVVSTVDSNGGDYIENLTYTLKYGQNEAGERVIKVLDITGDAEYDALKLNLPSGADISAIDEYVDAQIATLRA